MYLGAMDLSVYFVHSYSITDNSSLPLESTGGKIKGVQLWGARIRADRTLQSSGTDNFRRTNCRNWHPAEQCPAGAVIVGMRAHHEEGKGFVGLSIRCGRVS